MRVIRIVNHIGMLLLMGVPIVLSGRDNLFEQFGHGTGQVWDSWSDVGVIPEGSTIRTRRMPVKGHE